MTNAPTDTDATNRPRLHNFVTLKATSDTLQATPYKTSWSCRVPIDSAEQLALYVHCNSSYFFYLGKIGFAHYNAATIVTIFGLGQRHETVIKRKSQMITLSVELVAPAAISKCQRTTQREN